MLIKYESREDYMSHLREEVNYVRLTSALNNGFILTDRFGIIGDSLISKYGLEDITGIVVDTETGESFEDEVRKYWIEDYEDFCNCEEIVVVSMWGA